MVGRKVKPPKRTGKITQKQAEEAVQKALRRSMQRSDGKKENLKIVSYGKTEQWDDE